MNFSLNGLVGFDIHGKTVGIVGTGKIGRIAAQIFRGFDANVMAYEALSEIARVTTMNILAQETNQPFLKGTVL